jgi:transposase
LHVDDTPVPVLVPGTGKTKTGWLWAYVPVDGEGFTSLDAAA